MALFTGCAATISEGGHDWSEEPHHVSTLIASTIEEDRSAPSIGLDYEYRVDSFLGVGGVVEHAFDDVDTTILLAVVDLHITPHFIVQTGPGVDFVEGDTEVAYRLGVLYEFERHGYTVSPQIHYDWTTGEDAVVIGIALGFAF